MSEYIYEHKPSGADHMGKPVELPTLVQREEIVRCRDCEYRGNPRKCWLGETRPDEFCSRGKRKECGDGLDAS